MIELRNQSTFNDFQSVKKQYANYKKSIKITLFYF